MFYTHVPMFVHAFIRNEMVSPEVAERLKLCVDLRVKARPGQKESQEEPRFTSPFDKGVK